MNSIHIFIVVLLATSLVVVSTNVTGKDAQKGCRLIPKFSSRIPLDENESQLVKCPPDGVFEAHGDQKINSITLTIALNGRGKLPASTKVVTLSELPESVSYLRNFSTSNFWKKNPGIREKLEAQGVDLNLVGSVLIVGFERSSENKMKSIVDDRPPENPRTYPPASGKPKKSSP